MIGPFVTSELAPLLREHGFKRAGQRFERRVGKVRQLVVIEASKYGGGVFFVGLGLVFAEIPRRGRALVGGVVVHYDDSLSRVTRGAPKQWKVPAPRLRGLLAPVLDRLAKVDSAKAMLREKLDPMEEGFRKQLRAQLKAASGDLRGALADLRKVAREFPDRVTVEQQVKQLGLAKLLSEVVVRR